MSDGLLGNKILGAVLGTALMVFGIKEIAGAVYNPHAVDHEKPGFLIEVAEAPEAGGGEPKEEVPIAKLLATADAAAGAKVFGACAGCHTVNDGGENKKGPNLWDVVERGIASHAGFGYSEAAKGLAAEKWTYENLNTFLKNPKGYMKGTAMTYGGLKNDEKRANLIAYLASLSGSPKPFPAP
jgi:cytochrome c